MITHGLKKENRSSKLEFEQWKKIRAEKIASMEKKFATAKRILVNTAKKQIKRKLKK
jgi:hypothetical protein